MIPANANFVGAGTGNHTKEFCMKNFFKARIAPLFGIIALVAVIGFSMAACDFGGSDDSDENENGDNGGSSGGGGGANPTITIKNSTGYTISGIYIKASTSTSWGSNLYNYSSLSDGSSRTFTLTQPLSTQNVYDIQLSQNSSGGGFKFTKYGVTVSNGMTITFTTSDSSDGSNLPRITIQNRSGKKFDSLHVSPSSSSNWGSSFGSIANNSSLSVTIPIPPSSYTAFDIQARSTNPTNTYTRNNVTITNGMTLMFTSADADNPTIELPVIVIQNSTGYTISGIYIKSSTSTSWGSNLYNYSSLSDGSSRTFSLTQHLSTQDVYDIRLSQNSNGSGFKFTKYNITVSEGMILTFTTSDLE